ncbi:hypothetical protein OH77DRAFT_1159913 [Trametes cingulata]|nr:hypothetical protein OH77DRAFT_1159913 [Trametes cingulata]
MFFVVSSRSPSFRRVDSWSQRDDLVPATPSKKAGRVLPLSAHRANAVLRPRGAGLLFLCDSISGSRGFCSLRPSTRSFHAALPALTPPSPASHLPTLISPPGVRTYPFGCGPALRPSSLRSSALARRSPTPFTFLLREASFTSFGPRPRTHNALFAPRCASAAFLLALLRLDRNHLICHRSTAASSVSVLRPRAI